jgi:anti-sigma factor RsiW
MIESHEDSLLRPWLEQELSRQLRPVAAPESLWNRIHEQRRPLRVRPRFGTLWLAAAVALLTLSGGMVAQFSATRDPAPDLLNLAERELQADTDSSGAIGFRSGDPGEIRTWVKRGSGIDIDLPERTNGTVSLVGARLMRMDGFPVAAITYRVGKDFAAMVVTGRRGGLKRNGHIGQRSSSRGDTRLFSWNMSGELYTIALARATDSRAACILCHAEPHGLPTLN